MNSGRDRNWAVRGRARVTYSVCSDGRIAFLYERTETGSAWSERLVAAGTVEFIAAILMLYIDALPI